MIWCKDNKTLSIPGMHNDSKWAINKKRKPYLINIQILTQKTTNFKELKKKLRKIRFCDMGNERIQFSKSLSKVSFNENRHWMTIYLGCFEDYF